MAGKVTDPALLAALDGTPAAEPAKVQDPALLAQLEGGAPAPGLGDTIVAGVGRGAWAPLGLVGIDHAKAQAAYQWLKQRLGGGEPDFAALESGQRGLESAAEKARPIVTALSIGAGATPAAAALPVVAPAVGTGLGARSAAGAITGAAQGAALEGGLTSDAPLSDRLARMGTAAVMGGTLGALVPGAPVGALSRSELASAAGEAPTAGIRDRLADFLRRVAGERNIKAAGGIQSDIVRARKQLGPGGANDGREALTEIGAEMGDKGLVSSFSTPAKTFDRAVELMDDAGGRMGDILAEADKAAQGGERPQIQNVLSAGEAILDRLRSDPHPGSQAAAERFAATLQAYRERVAGVEAPKWLGGPKSNGPGAAFTRTETGPSRTVTESVTPAGSGDSYYRPRYGDPATLQTRTVPGKTTQTTEWLPPVQSSGPSVAFPKEPKPLSFSGAHALRRMIDDEIFGTRGTRDPWANKYTEALRDLRGAVSDEIVSKLDEATAQSFPWKAANRDYQVAAKALEFADKGMDRAHGNNQVSPTELMSALGGMAGMGAATGSPAGAGIGGLAMYGATALARRHGSGIQGAVAGNLSRAIRPNPRAASPLVDPEIAAFIAALRDPRSRFAPAVADEDQTK